MVHVKEALRTLSGLVLLTSLICGVQGGTAPSDSHLRGSDPDPTCREAFIHDPESCLNTRDKQGRPCELCVSDKNEKTCLNADEAWWAKVFGETCETESLKGEWSRNS